MKGQSSIRINILFIFLLTQCIRCDEKSALEQLLDDQNIQYKTIQPVINIIAQTDLSIDLFLENTNVNQCLHLPQLSNFSARIRLVNVNINVKRDDSYCLALLNSTSVIQNMDITEITLTNITTNQQLLNLALSGCTSCSISSISLLNYISSSALFYFLGVKNLSITNFRSDLSSILMSQLPVVQITTSVDVVTFKDFQVPSLSSTKTTTITTSDFQLPAQNDSKSQLYSQIQSTDYNNEQRSFFQIQVKSNNIMSSPISDQYSPITFDNINLDFQSQNIRFLDFEVNSQVQIMNSQFKGNKALANGGSIYSLGGMVLVNSTVFDSCSSEQFGGAIFTMRIRIDESIIKNCKSKIGGGLFIGSDDTAIPTTLQFNNNYASITQPDFFICHNDVTGKLGICSLFEVDSTIEYNAQLQGTPLYMNPNNLTYIKVGAPDRIIPVSEVWYGAIQIIKLKIKFNKFPTSETIEIKDFDGDQILGNLYDYLTDEYKQYFYYLPIQNITYPYLISAYTGFLDCSQINLIFFEFNYFPTIKGRTYACYQVKSQCQNGMIEFKSIANQQIYTNCQYCGVGMFSYEVSSNCTVCNPQLYDYCYANVSFVKNGTWRNQLSTGEASMYECSLSSDNCYSVQRDGVGNSLCAEGYMSEQCLTCDLRGQIWMDSYGETGQFQCAKCSSLSNNSIYFVLSMCFQLLLFAFTLYSNQGRMRNQILRTYLSKLQIIYIGTSFIRQSQTAVYIKILLFNFQIYLTAYFFINFNQSNDSFDSNFFSFFNPFQSVGNYSYDCFLNEVFPQNKSIGFAKLQVAFFTPLILTGGILIITLLILFLRKRRFISLLYIMVHCFSYSILFLFQQSNLLYSISSLKCLQLTNQNRYMLLDTNIDCDNSNQVTKMRSLGIISIVFYIVTIPLSLFTLLFLQRKNLDKIKVICLYGFLYDEYKRKYYYWQFIKVLLAALLTILLQEIKTYIILAVIIYLSLLSLYAIAVSQLKPFQTMNLNKIELTSAVLSILYLLSSMSLQLSYSQKQQYEDNSTSRVISSILYYTVLVCLSIFYIYMAILIVSSFFQTSIQKLQTYRLFKYIEKRFPSIVSKLYSKKLRDNFKILRQKVLSMNHPKLSNVLYELQESESHQLLSEENSEKNNEENVINLPQ